MVAGIGIVKNLIQSRGNGRRCCQSIYFINSSAVILATVVLILCLLFVLPHGRVIISVLSSILCAVVQL